MALIDQLNKHIQTKIKVEEVDLEFWKQFPKVSVTFNNIRVKESIPGSEDNLAVFKRGYFMLDLYEVIMGSYGVEKILLENGRIQAKVQEAGTQNFQVIKPSKESDGSSDKKKEFTFNLKQITFRNTIVSYHHVPKKVYLKLFGEQVNFQGRFKANQFTLKADGRTLFEELTIDSSEFIANKKVELRTEFDVDNEKGVYQLTKGDIQVAGAGFDVSGHIKKKAKGHFLDLEVQGENNNLGTLLSLVPETYRTSFASYNGQGNFYFKGTSKGYLTGQENPRINFEFGIEDGKISKSGVEKSLEQVKLKGRVTNGKSAGLKTSLVEIVEFNATLNNRSLSGDMSLANWTDPYLNLAINTNVFLEDLQEFLPVSTFEKMEGGLNLNAAFAGRIRHLKQMENVHKTNLAGSVLLSDAGIITEAEQPDYKELNGKFRFNGNDLMIDRFSGLVGDSDFKLQGRFNNLASFLFLPDKELKVEANFNSKHINLQPLVTTEYSQQSHDSVLTFALPNYLVLDLDLNCDTVTYDRFAAYQVQGDIDYANEALQLNGLKFNSMEGNIGLGGQFFSDEKGNLNAQLKANCKAIDLERLFFQLHNFGQDVLTNRHLKGTLDAQIELNTVWDENLVPQYDQLKVNSSVTIKNGELNNFQPVMQMAVLANVDELRNMEFDKLTNNVMIRNETIRIPEMVISSNAFNLDFSGKHHFDNTIDYHMRLNLSELLFGKKEDYENEFGKVVYDNEGDMNLFIQMVGKADDPKIQYDRKAVTRKIGKDLAEEGKEIKEAIESGSNSESDKEEYELEWDK